MKALSFKQPWADAVLYGGKTIENRVKWKNSKFRGEFLIQTSLAMTQREYREVLSFLDERKISWRPDGPTRLVHGAVVGRAKVVGVVLPSGLVQCGEAPPRKLTVEERSWWMGAFALVLEDVVAFSYPVPCKGMLGWFSTPLDREGRRVA